MLVGSSPHHPPKILFDSTWEKEDMYYFSTRLFLNLSGSGDVVFQLLPAGVYLLLSLNRSGIFMLLRLLRILHAHPTSTISWAPKRFKSEPSFPAPQLPSFIRFVSMSRAVIYDTKYEWNQRQRKEQQTQSSRSRINHIIQRGYSISPVKSEVLSETYSQH